jgi:F0F1-type ATP synthase alpha subunit
MHIITELDLIKAQNKNDLLEAGIGTVVSCGSGVVNIKGLTYAAVGEIFSIITNRTVSLGQVINLTRSRNKEIIAGGILIDPSIRISEGSYATGLSQLATVFLNDSILGSLLNAQGEGVFLGINELTPISRAWLVESPAPFITIRSNACSTFHRGESKEEGS